MAINPEVLQVLSGLFQQQGGQAPPIQNTALQRAQQAAPELQQPQIVSTSPPIDDSLASLFGGNEDGKIRLSPQGQVEQPQPEMSGLAKLLMVLNAMRGGPM
jgi:hypothetical protein